MSRAPVSCLAKRAPELKTTIYRSMSCMYLIQYLSSGLILTLNSGSPIQPRIFLPTHQPNPPPYPIANRLDNALLIDFVSGKAKMLPNLFLQRFLKIVALLDKFATR